jgi:hypothetical protein
MVAGLRNSIGIYFFYCRYFTDKGLLDRLPTLFLILAGIYAVCQIIGIAALSKPPEDEVEAKRLLNDSRSSDGQIHGYY